MNAKLRNACMHVCTRLSVCLSECLTVCLSVYLSLSRAILYAFIVYCILPNLGLPIAVHRSGRFRKTVVEPPRHKAPTAAMALAPSRLALEFLHRPALVPSRTLRHHQRTPLLAGDVQIL